MLDVFCTGKGSLVYETHQTWHFVQENGLWCTELTNQGASYRRGAFGVRNGAQRGWSENFLTSLDREHYQQFGLFALEGAVDRFHIILVVGGVELVDGVLIATGGDTDYDMTVVVGDL